MNETITYKGCTIRIETDEDPQNPRTEWDNLGTMVCAHRRYNLGDVQDSEPDIPKGAIVLPLYLYDHSGLSISTRSFVGRAHHAEWDSGQVGVIYVTQGKVLKEYGKKNVTKKLREKVEEVLRGEVETYDQYLRGEVYGYLVEGPNGEEIGSCWGFIGEPDGYVLEKAKSAVDYWLATRGEQAEQHRALIG